MNKRTKYIIGGSILGGLLLGIFIASFVIPQITEFISAWGINELLAAITLAGVLVALAAPLIDAYTQKKIRKR